MEKSSGSPHYLAAIEVVIAVAAFLKSLELVDGAEPQTDELVAVHEAHGAYLACIKSNASYGVGGCRAAI